MSQLEKPMKISKQLRLKAQEFLASKKNSQSLMEIVNHFECGVDQSSCLLALELIFTTLLKEREMLIEVVPLKPVEKTPENQYKEWLTNAYEQCFAKILESIENNNGSQKVQIQVLSTAMNILAHEGKYPLESKGSLDNYVPLPKLKSILMKILSNKQNNIHLINKYTEYLLFDDILFFTWKLLPSLTAKSNPNDVYIMNYLLLLEKLQVYKNTETKILCSAGDGSFFTFDETVTIKCLNKIWHCVMQWQHTPHTHKQLLVVLLDRVLSHLEKPLVLTGFLMDSLDLGGSVSLLALQGIFILIQVHNLDYPNIFVKLYSMFEPEIFHTKYKARLFYLSDVFLSSTHLPENLVAAFVKRLARLSLIAPSEDLPSTSEGWEEIAKEFKDLWNFPMCIGAMDGKHIILQAPLNSGSEFFNYKSFFSIVLMALTDAEYKFTYVNVGCQGRISDGGVFNNTFLRNALFSESLHLPVAKPLPGRAKPLEYVIVADDAFPLTTNIMKPYPGPHAKTSKERSFNYRLSRARRISENVFGILSSVFRVLRKPLLLQPEKAEKIVLACVHLHNFLRTSPGSNSYMPLGELDRENSSTGEIIEGLWRQDSEQLTSMLPLNRVGRKSSASAQEARNEFADYFLTEQGRVPWQDKYC